MQSFIAKIGKGPKTSKDLTWDEARQAMRLLIEQRATPAQVGAFLVGLRVKMESVAELAALTATAREYVPPVPVPGDLSLVDLPSYLQKHETLHVFLAAGIVAAAGGASVLLHGHDEDAGVGTGRVLARLGISPDLDTREASEALAGTGFAYLDVALYHPPLARLLDLRRELGLRHVFHVVAALLNPARASSQVVGVSYPGYLDKAAEALSMLSASRALVLLGVEGAPELSIAGRTKLVELRDGRIGAFTYQAKDAGLPQGRDQDMAGFPPDQVDKEAKLLQRLLHNEVRGGQRDWLLLNAGMLLYAAGKAPSIHGAVAVATRLLESGAASRKLEQVAAGAPLRSEGERTPNGRSNGRGVVAERPSPEVLAP